MCFSKHLAKFAMLIQLVLLLLCYGVENAHCVHDNSKDLQSLLDFKQGVTTDPYRALSSWNTSVQYCRWSGVICTLTRPWRVSGLNLTGKSLAGDITSSLVNLTHLSVLDLSSNSFSGQLPPLGGLQLLETIYLNDNSLDGTIPDALTNCSNLVNLDLHNNQLSGFIPPKIGLLSNLEYLDLSSNNLTGIIPRTFSNLTRVSFCKLKSNQLEGSIPDEIWLMSNMGQLLLGNNTLSGNIPTAINMSQLRSLDLELNMLGKALPSNFGEVLPRLEEIDLNTNMFEGHIPASLGNATLLKLIELSVNHFTGPIPVSLGSLSSLYFLSLEQNQLETGDNQSWEFLHELSKCKDLDTLSLYDNRMEGVLPDSIGNLSVGLEYLLLGKNSISGIVPVTIGNLRNLVKLGLGDNNLRGGIGEWIGNLKKLQGLHLNGNSFTGPIPSAIGNLTKLTLLFLQNNEFESLIPPSLGNLSQLSVLNLSYNNLQGYIPLGVGNLKQLIQLHLSSNNLTERIPDTLGQCHNLETIKMDQNFLTGDIPLSLSGLTDLGLLNLSHNNLTGNIPVALENLSLLLMVDLSYNDLQGEIPTNGVFANASAISLDGNMGLCGGVANLHMRLCSTASHKSGRQQYFLVRVLIPLFGFMSLVLLVYMLLIVKKSQRKKFVPLNSYGDNFLKVSYNELAQATTNFSESNLVGKGSYGTVYRGKLKEHKMDVAVKVFNLEMQGAERSFLSECEALRSIQHRNLLPIITACSTVDTGGNVFKALIYEYMPNGNLDTWLHHKLQGKSRKSLGLTQRISVAVNVADALDYLHHDCGRLTVHCDLKPCNILLDEDMTALLGDFGIARFYVDFISASTASISSIGVRGTIGYIAPEYAGGGHPSSSGDVYSFGIVLLEMLTGKRPTDPMFKDGLDIVNFVESNFPHQVFQVIDDHLIEECKDFTQRKMVPENVVNECVIMLLQVALSCTRLLPSDRMNMKQIASKLHAIKTSHLGWKK